MNTGKKSIQELILNTLSKKRAARARDLTEHIEIILTSQEDVQKIKPKYIINRTIKKMIDDNTIESYDTEQSSFLSLTSFGRQKLRNIRLSSHSHLVSTQWDGYWRMVIVDIPETRKKDQDAIRYILKKAQFVQLKGSVWITPYPLEHMMINMKSDMNLNHELIVLVTNKLDPDTEKLLQEKFMEK